MKKKDIFVYLIMDPRNPNGPGLNSNSSFGL